MHPQHDHFLYELGRLQVDQPQPDPHHHHAAEQLSPTPSRFDLFKNGTQFLSQLRKIRIQVTFEVAEPCP